MGKPDVIHQAYRFALAPTAEQEAFLASCCSASRFWFNQGLALVRERLDQRRAGNDVRVPWSYKALCSEFAPLKEVVCPWRSEVVVGSMQAGLEQLGRALQNHTKGTRAGRRVGFPRFRKRGRCHESVIFQRPRIGDRRTVLLDRRLGPLRTRESLRKLARLLESDEQARILRSTVQRSPGGWVISFTVQRSPKGRHARRPDAVVGVDLGITRLATLSTAHTVANVRALDAALGKIRRLQRQLGRQRRSANPGNYLPDGEVKPGPRDWAKSQRMRHTEVRLARLYMQVANQRREQAHRLTTYLTREFGVIGVETLSVKNLLANRRLARHISDVGWGIVLGQLAYKTFWSTGSMLVAADRFFPSSRMCSTCGTVRVKLSLSERVFTCEACGSAMDRDLNAAINLAHVALRRTQAEGLQLVVAATGAETENARRGQVRLDPIEHSPMKREGSSESSQRRDALARAS